MGRVLLWLAFGVLLLIVTGLALLGAFTLTMLILL